MAPHGSIDRFRTLYGRLGILRKNGGDRHFIDWNEGCTQKPQYAWQWNLTSEEYKEIKELVADYKADLKSIATEDRISCKLIQLYISEWYKREFNGNDGQGNAFTSIGAKNIAKDICKKLGIDESLVYKAHLSGQSEWLKTIYVDGGLPLNYLQKKSSALNRSILEIIDKGESDLGRLCDDNVINQSYQAHFEGEGEASIFDFVQEVIIGDNFVVDGFEEFETIIHEVKRNFRPKFYFDWGLIELDGLWYREYSFSVKRGSSIESANYFDYSRIKDWLPEESLDVSNAAWCDIFVYTSGDTSTPALFIKAYNNFQGQFFIPTRSTNHSFVVDGAEVVSSVKVRFEKMLEPREIRPSEYVVSGLDVRVQLDEVAPGCWRAHRKNSGCRSAVFLPELDDAKTAIDDGSVYHVEDIEVSKNYSLKKIDVFGTLKFTDGMVFHSAMKFSVIPMDTSCRQICFSNNGWFPYRSDGIESQSLLLVVDRDDPRSSYQLYYFGQEMDDVQLIGFDETADTPYKTQLSAEIEGGRVCLGDAVIIPRTKSKPPINIRSSGGLKINCTPPALEPDIITLRNDAEDTYDYELQLSDGTSIILRLYPPYDSSDIIQMNPRRKLNSFENRVNGETESFSETLSRFMKYWGDDSLVWLDKASRIYASKFYIRKRCKKGGLQTENFYRHQLKSDCRIRYVEPSKIRFLVDPELGYIGRDRQFKSLDCDQERTNFFRFTEESLAIMKAANSSLTICQKEGVHLQVFDGISVSGDGLISFTQRK